MERDGEFFAFKFVEMAKKTNNRFVYVIYLKISITFQKDIRK